MAYKRNFKKKKDEKKKLLEDIESFDSMMEFFDDIGFRKTVAANKMRYYRSPNGTATIEHIPTGHSVIFPIDDKTSIRYKLFNFRKLLEKIKPTNRFV